jgi:hypothetical protein
MNSRTVRDFQVGADITPVVDAWAQANHFGFRGVAPDGTRKYQRGSALTTGAKPVSILQNGHSVHLEAWIHTTLVGRVLTFFLLPADMSIESGGVRNVVPRSIARGSVNKLLEQLGQPPIG